MQKDKANAAAPLWFGVNDDSDTSESDDSGRGCAPSVPVIHFGREVQQTTKTNTRQTGHRHRREEVSSTWEVRR